MLDNYLIIIEKQENNYSAYCPDADGCIATGETPGKYRSGCLQSSIRWNMGSPVKELEKVPKDLKGSAAL